MRLTSDPNRSRREPPQSFSTSQPPTLSHRVPSPATETLSLSTHKVRFSGESSTAQTPPTALKSFFNTLWQALKAPIRWMSLLLESIGLKKKSGPGTATEVLHFPKENFPLGKLTSRQIFGNDPAKIRMQQGSGNTCYLLSTLDNIFHHPQAFRILDQIQVLRIPDGFKVKFPGQWRSLKVKDTELEGPDYAGVRSNLIGVCILEKAYSKLPNTLYPNFDTGADAYKRIFGKGVGSLATLKGSSNDASRFPDTPPDLSSAWALRDSQDFADLWIGQKTYKDADEKLRQEEHYYSFRQVPNDPTHFDLANPFDTTDTKRHTMDEINRDWVPELIRIPLQPTPWYKSKPSWR